MTKKLKRQLFKSRIFIISALTIPLVAFYIYATALNNSFFIFLIVAAVAVIAYLVPSNHKLSLRKSEIELHIEDLKERKNLEEAGIVSENKAIESFREKIVSFSELKGLTEKLSMCVYLDETSKTFSEEVNKLFGYKETTIILYLFHSKTGDLGISSSHKGEMRVNIRLKQGDVFDRWVVKTMQPLFIEDIRNDFRFDTDNIQYDEARVIRSLISVPLVVGHKALGILRIDSSVEKHFTTEDLRFLMTIGDLGAVAIENAQLYERVEQLAIRDGLTDLYLRRYLFERMPKEVSRHLRSKSPMSFIMIDLDYFKNYNDSFGHIAGDIVLKSVGEMLKEFFNDPGSLVCRYGGEEFCVLLPDCDKEKASALANGIREKVANETIYLRRKKTNITISLGVATFPEDAQIKEDLIHKADLALYEAKNTGRDKVCVA